MNLEHYELEFELSNLDSGVDFVETFFKMLIMYFVHMNTITVFSILHDLSVFHEYLMNTFFADRTFLSN